MEKGSIFRFYVKFRGSMLVEILLVACINQVEEHVLISTVLEYIVEMNCPSMGQWN